MRRAVPILVIAFGAVALAFWPHVNPDSPTSPPAPTTSEDRILKLKKQIGEQEVDSAQAVANYVPIGKTRIDDLGSPVVDLLRQLPSVVQVNVGVAAKNPSKRIIHLRDWHHVPKDLYALDMKEALRRELTIDEIDRLHQELLLEVELVQIEQMAVLRCLIKHHGLKKVFSEGFSPNDLEAYRERIAVLRAIDREQIPQVQRQLEEVRKLQRNEKAKGIEVQLLTMLDEHKHRLLEMGAAGRLLISGDLEDVLPIEDADALAKAKPVTSGGVKLDAAMLEARHDAQVKAVLKQGPVAFIVLGGAHDLTESIQRLGGENCEYLRLTTKRFREFGE